MPLGLDSIYATLQQGVQAINNLRQTISTVFPQITTTSTSAPATNGTVTFSSSLAVGYMLVTLPNGTTVKVPYYNQ